MGFCAVELQIATKKETLRQELQRLRYIVKTPLLINYLTDAKDLLRSQSCELTWAVHVTRLEAISDPAEPWNSPKPPR